MGREKVLLEATKRCNIPYINVRGPLRKPMIVDRDMADRIIATGVQGVSYKEESVFETPDDVKPTASFTAHAGEVLTGDIETEITENIPSTTPVAPPILTSDEVPLPEEEDEDFEDDIEEEDEEEEVEEDDDIEEEDVEEVEEEEVEEEDVEEEEEEEIMEGKDIYGLLDGKSADEIPAVVEKDDFIAALESMTEDEIIEYKDGLGYDAKLKIQKRLRKATNVKRLADWIYGD